VTEVVKVKSMATQEIGLNEALEAAGVTPVETDLAELIVQLAEDTPSHILVPAIHYNRGQIRDIFARRMPGVDVDRLTDDPPALAEAARRHLRARFLSARVAISGANFAIAENGGLVVVESEGNGRMCLTLPETLISVVGVEKVLPTFRDLEVFLQLLPRSSTGERMNPYTSVWTGVTPGDGPQTVHIVLVDNGRTQTLADPVGRQALRCIRCSACLNVCPVYERVGGHAYGSVYPGPIGAILSPQMSGEGANRTLPYASTLCGACYDACPVRINIPEVLVHLRQIGPKPATERAAMRAAAYVMRDRRRYAAALRAARRGSALVRKDKVRRLPWPLSAWTSSRDAALPAKQTFREWWTQERRNP
jgi:L-lactate dehydrogenase complex protein LldF